MEQELTCIRCPMGCQLRVKVDGKMVTVTGNTCPHGKEYGIKEVTNPTRTVTSSVKVIDGELPLVSVKTRTDIPKDRIFLVMEEIKKACVKAPINIGDSIIENVAETGSDVIATRSVKSKE